MFSNLPKRLVFISVLPNNELTFRIWYVESQAVARLLAGVSAEVKRDWLAEVIVAVLQRAQVKTLPVMLMSIESMLLAVNLLLLLFSGAGAGGLGGPARPPGPGGARGPGVARLLRGVFRAAGAPPAHPRGGLPPRGRGPLS